MNCEALSRMGKKVHPGPEMCHNSGCLYSISGFLMALTAALKAQIAAWYKALQEQIPDFIPVRRSGR
jgi:hypothetical protein